MELNQDKQDFYEAYKLFRDNAEMYAKALKLLGKAPQMESKLKEVILDIRFLDIETPEKKTRQANYCKIKREVKALLALKAKGFDFKSWIATNKADGSEDAFIEHHEEDLRLEQEILSKFEVFDLSDSQKRHVLFIELRLMDFYRKQIEELESKYKQQLTTNQRLLGKYTTLIQGKTRARDKRNSFVQLRLFGGKINDY